MIDQAEQTNGSLVLPEFEKKDMLAVFCILLGSMGGKVSIDADQLKKFPDGVMINAEYDARTKAWTVSLPPMKRKRGIITPKQKKLILNN
ncbi:MAG: hypothetical protein Q7T18_06715 [Sedimentisphaerales bacterium]|nr:hypothetical protein [Sedimentisphaerales bacterium]